MDFDKEGYNDKKKELKFYLKCLNATYEIELEANSGIPYGKHFQTKFSKYSYELGDFIVILKSNTYLMVYNIVESTTRELISHIYDEVNGSSLRYQDINDKLQILWKDYHFRKIESEIHASSQTFIDTASKMIDEIFSESSIQFNNEDISLSGDADLRSISKLFHSHGIELDKNTTKRYKSDLWSVKNSRNSLAHGRQSFIDLGRDTTIVDLEKISDHIFKFLEYLIRMTDRLIQKEYFQN
ncbi:hypothetical protein C5Z25_01735 [Lactobacillus sp. CBA3605]|uniref:MAE_28990/MAE_18760 family HEPN-like nuclease n=1 Tax=Lactobacillus sp. CBA3605 TaxID=2099788 RepID=UPI000CFBBC9B|nr:MAE_28990/MAE_18760 family HEPN-like nuclease [Lactobacillus sp. CBA3605]AVK60568.1 hypothetical protein C5Z25_01735 [Lactobacillus sp. CBA3605]